MVMQIDPSKLGYRPCVGIMVVNAQGLVWIGQRPGARLRPEGPGSWWQMPQGGIDEDENPRAAALRELYEETRIRSVEIIAETHDWLLYDLPPELVGKAWGGRYRGQKQKWFAVRFHGSDDEVNLTPPPGHQVEFDEWRWVPMSELVDMVVPFKREVYRAVVAEFGPLVRSV